jgi:hypothetical protein
MMQSDRIQNSALGTPIGAQATSHSSEDGHSKDSGFELSYCTMFIGQGPSK